MSATAEPPKGRRARSTRANLVTSAGQRASDSVLDLSIRASSGRRAGDRAARRRRSHERHARRRNTEPAAARRQAESAAGAGQRSNSRFVSASRRRVASSTRTPASRWVCRPRTSISACDLPADRWLLATSGPARGPGCSVLERARRDARSSRGRSRARDARRLRSGNGSCSASASRRSRGSRCCWSSRGCSRSTGARARASPASHAGVQSRPDRARRPYRRSRCCVSPRRSRKDCSARPTCTSRATVRSAQACAGSRTAATMRCRGATRDQRSALGIQSRPCSRGRSGSPMRVIGWLRYGFARVDAQRLLARACRASPPSKFRPRRRHRRGRERTRSACDAATQRSAAPMRACDAELLLAHALGKSRAHGSTRGPSTSPSRRSARLSRSCSSAQNAASRSRI